MRLDESFRRLFESGYAFAEDAFQLADALNQTYLHLTHALAQGGDIFPGALT